ncbi:hypothetical protein [Nocardia sp. NPDC020380]|uniref:hypothetical protein n=1 Tax=Nocardia sp. NPDC020380 TaxID=3364309 RepID=UPI0037B1EC17
MGLIWLAAIAILLMMLLYCVFPLLARLIGFFIIFDSLLAIVLIPARAIPGRLSELALGFLIWLIGHWAWAFKHGVWDSRLALRVFSLPGLRRLIPRSTLIYDDSHR